MADEKVTIRLEGDGSVLPDGTWVPDKPEDGGKPPEPPKSNLLEMRKTREVCWPCVLLGVAVVMAAIATVWLQFVDLPEPRG